MRGGIRDHSAQTGRLTHMRICCLSAATTAPASRCGRDLAATELRVYPVGRAVARGTACTVTLHISHPELASNSVPHSNLYCR